MRRRKEMREASLPSQTLTQRRRQRRRRLPSFLLFFPVSAAHARDDDDQRGRLDEPTRNVTKLCISGSAAENKS